MWACLCPGSFFPLSRWMHSQNLWLLLVLNNTVVVVVVVVVVVIIIKLEGCNWPLFIFHGHITGEDEGISYFFRHIRMASSMIHYKPFDQAVGNHTHKVLNEIISTLYWILSIQRVLQTTNNNYQNICDNSGAPGAQMATTRSPIYIETCESLFFTR